MLYIRADGNAEIGMGHVMRCLSVADAAAELDREHKPVFIVADEGCRGMIEDRGFRVIVLHTDYKNMMSETGQLREILDGDVVLVDSYQVCRDYFMELRKFAWVACFEDMGEAYPVNLLINYNVYAPGLKENYQNSAGRASGLLPESVLLGTAYMPLGKAFMEPSEYAVKEKVTDVIITTGGSDPLFSSAVFIERFLGNDRCFYDTCFRDICFHIISGPFNRFAKELRQRCVGCENVVIHEGVKDMRGLLLRSDVVLTATGSTIYEVSSLGVPMIVFYFAENQKQGAQALGTLTDIVNAGCFANEPDAVADRAAQALIRCIKDRGYRERLYKQEKLLVDAGGARRIAMHLAV